MTPCENAFYKIADFSCSVKNQIKDLSNLDGRRVVHYASLLIRLRNSIQSAEEIFYSKMFDRANYQKLIKAQERLNKAQFLLLDKSLGIIKDKNAFYKKIADVWMQHIGGGYIQDVKFGRDLLLHNPNDPLILDALTTYFDPTLPLRLEVKKHIHAFLTSVEAAHLMSCEESKNSLHFYEIVGDILDDKPRTIAELRRFVAQNKDHPIVKEAVNRFILQEWIFPLQRALKREDICTKATILHSMPQAVEKLYAQIGFDKTLTYFLNRVKRAQSLPNRATYRDIEELHYSILTICDAKDAKDPETLSCLKMSFEAMSYALRKVRFNSNWIWRSENSFHPKNYPIKEVRVIQQAIANCRLRVCSNDEWINAQDSNYQTETNPTGNCGEQADKILIYADSRGYKSKTIRLPNHVFPIIHDKVVADPFFRIIFPIRFRSVFGKDCEGLMKSGLVKTKKYDPKDAFLLAEN